MLFLHEHHVKDGGRRTSVLSEVFSSGCRSRRLKAYNDHANRKQSETLEDEKSTVTAIG